MLVLIAFAIKSLSFTANLSYLMVNSKSIDFENEFKAIFYLKPQTVLDHNLFLTNVNIFV